MSPLAQATTRTFGRVCLQVHAVDEVVRLLRVEGAGFLELVTDEPEATANHEQQQSGDDEAQSQRKDGTCWTKHRTRGQLERARTKRDLWGRGLTCLRYRVTPHYWDWFRDGGLAANMRDLRRKFKKCLISFHFRLYFSKFVFICTRLSLRGDGRSCGCWFESRTYESTKSPELGVFLCFHNLMKGLKHHDDAYFFGYNH